MITDAASDEGLSTVAFPLCLAGIVATGRRLPFSLVSKQTNETSTLRNCVKHIGIAIDMTIMTVHEHQ